MFRNTDSKKAAKRAQYMLNVVLVVYFVTRLNNCFVSISLQKNTLALVVGRNCVSIYLTLSRILPDSKSTATALDMTMVVSELIYLLFYKRVHE